MQCIKNLVQFYSKFQQSNTFFGVPLVFFVTKAPFTYVVGFSCPTDRAKLSLEVLSYVWESPTFNCSHTKKYLVMRIVMCNLQHMH